MATHRILLVLIPLISAGAVWSFSRPQPVAVTMLSPAKKADQLAAASPARLGVEEEIAAALRAGDRVAFSQAFSRCAAIDPRTAATLLDAAGAFREDAMRCLAQAWGKSDLVAARDWAASLPDANDRDRVLTYLSFTVAETDPGKALRFAQQEGLNDQNGTIRNLAHQWGMQDFASAREWALAVPKGPARDEIFSKLAMARAASDPMEAAQLVISEIPPGSAQDEAAMTVLNRWLPRDSKAAAEWVASFPDSDLKERASREVGGFLGSIGNP